MVGTQAKRRSWLLLCSLDSVLPQFKGGYAGLAVIECFNGALRFSIQSLNLQFDPAVSGQPQFKKAIAQGGNGLIDQDIPLLVNSFHIKLHLDQFPLTGGHVMNGSTMRLSYIGSHGYYHFVFR